jgi:hypothetical protein
MKIRIYFSIIISVTLLSSCALDNYDGPDVSLAGRIVYNGEPVNVEFNQVRIQLFESGWQLRNPIDVAIKQDGAFSAVLFKGSYKMVIPTGQGPFMTQINDQTQSDTIALELNGSQEFDIEVTPYYMVRNAQFAKNGNNVNASFSLEKIVNDVNAKDFERVFLYINKSQFVSGASNIKVSELAAGDISNISSVDMSAEIPALVPAQSYVYARIGVKISGVEDLIFSPVQKITF